jgi:hypothetical protein
MGSYGIEANVEGMVQELQRHVRWDPPTGLDSASSRINPVVSLGSKPGVIPVNSIGYEVFLLLLQFLNVICSIEIRF